MSEQLERIEAKLDIVLSVLDAQFPDRDVMETLKQVQSQIELTRLSELVSVNNKAIKGKVEWRLVELIRKSKDSSEFELNNKRWVIEPVLEFKRTPRAHFVSDITEINKILIKFIEDVITDADYEPELYKELLIGEQPLMDLEEEKMKLRTKHNIL